MKKLFTLCTIFCSLTFVYGNTDREDLIPEIIERRSIYSYDSSKPVTADQISALIEAARYAPSAHNEQPWNFIICDKNTNQNAYNKLFNCVAKTHQTWVQKAPLLILIVSNTKLQKTHEKNRWAEYDTGGAAAQMALQAVYMGLEGHQIIEGCDIEKIRTDFSIPQDYLPMAIMVVGYEDSTGKSYQRPERWGSEKNFFNGAWGTAYATSQSSQHLVNPPSKANSGNNEELEKSSVEDGSSAQEDFNDKSLLKENDDSTVLPYTSPKESSKDSSVTPQGTKRLPDTDIPQDEQSSKEIKNTGSDTSIGEGIEIKKIADSIEGCQENSLDEIEPNTNSRFSPSTEDDSLSSEDSSSVKIQNAAMTTPNTNQANPTETPNTTPNAPLNSPRPNSGTGTSSDKKPLAPDTSSSLLKSETSSSDSTIRAQESASNSPSLNSPAPGVTPGTHPNASTAPSSPSTGPSINSSPNSLTNPSTGSTTPGSSLNNSNPSLQQPNTTSPSAGSNSSIKKTRFKKDTLKVKKVVNDYAPWEKPPVTEGDLSQNSESQSEVKKIATRPMPLRISSDRKGSKNSNANTALKKSQPKGKGKAPTLKNVVSDNEPGEKSKKEVSKADSDHSLDTAMNNPTPGTGQNNPTSPHSGAIIRNQRREDHLTKKNPRLNSLRTRTNNNEGSEMNSKSKIDSTNR